MSVCNKSNSARAQANTIADVRNNQSLVDTQCKDDTIDGLCLLKPYNNELHNNRTTTKYRYSFFICQQREAQ